MTAGLSGKDDLIARARLLGSARNDGGCDGL